MTLNKVEDDIYQVGTLITCPRGELAGTPYEVTAVDDTHFIARHCERGFKIFSGKNNLWSRYHGEK